MDKNRKNQAKFIKTQDLKTHEELTKMGFKLVDYTDGTWTFVNNIDCPLTFDNNKITYSNMLCF
jgi:hypothetical protein